MYFMRCKANGIGAYREEGLLNCLVSSMYGFVHACLLHVTCGKVSSCVQISVVQ